MTQTIREWQRAVWQCADEKGWHTGGDIGGVSVPEKIALIHSEASEALEEFRDSSPAELKESYFPPGSSKPEGFGVELADIVIRVLDLAECAGIDLQRCINEKHAYNLTRPFRHGGKRA